MTQFITAICGIIAMAVSLYYLTHPDRGNAKIGMLAAVTVAMLLWSWIHGGPT